MKFGYAIAAAAMLVGLVTGQAGASGQIFAVDQPAPLLPYSDKPAVSAFNGKFEAAYLWTRVDGAGSSDGLQVAGALTFPLGNRFGLQVDGGVGRIGGGATAFGVGAHLFWRKPETALLGMYGDFQRISALDISSWRVAVEGELYLGRFTLEGLAGAERVDAAGLAGTDFIGEAIAAYYFADNFRIHGGAGYRFERAFARIGAEAMLPFAANNVALFADGTFAEHATTVRAGVRVYFGQAGKSLLARHREDDPGIRLFDAMPASGRSPSKSPPADIDDGSGEGSGEIDWDFLCQIAPTATECFGR
jgi:hypothetical protein